MVSRVFILLFSLALLAAPQSVLAHDGEAPIDAHGSSSAAAVAQWPLLLGAVVAGGAAAGGMRATGGRRLALPQLAVIGLGSATGVIHLGVGLTGDALLALNGAGFLAILALLYLPLPVPAALRRPLRVGLMVYTSITLIGYFALHADYDVVGVFAKVIEVALLGVLGFQLLGRREVDPR